MRTAYSAVTRGIEVTAVHMDTGGRGDGGAYGYGLCGGQEQYQQYWQSTQSTEVAAITQEVGSNATACTCMYWQQAGSSNARRRTSMVKGYRRADYCYSSNVPSRSMNTMNTFSMSL